jgi:hypothetical protein
MKIQNIDRILLFRTESSGRQLTLEELRDAYPVSPDGTNFYYGVNQINVDAFASTGSASALAPRHREFFDAILLSLGTSPDDEKTVVLGVEPPSDQRTPYDYDFVIAHLDLVRQLAIDLAQIQRRARDFGKRLNIAIRYASEMNDKRSNPAKYKSSHIAVRAAFAELAPAVLFSFSPALRADLPESAIADYWPGSQYVDLIGGTWYIHGSEQRARSTANMRAYFLHRVGAGKPFALSEIGGGDDLYEHNDDMLQTMLHELESLQMQDVSFKYATIFLASRWGTDATLAFLEPEQPQSPPAQPVTASGRPDAVLSGR